MLQRTRQEFPGTGHAGSGLERENPVESRCGAVAGSGEMAVGLLAHHRHPSTELSPRFHIPLIEPDVRYYRIRLSDKTSRLHPRLTAAKLGQTYEPEVPVEMG
jgi:hypothetical protein